MSDTPTRVNGLTDHAEPIFPPDAADDEPTDANPVPLSPTKPEHRTSDGAREPATGAVFGVPAAGSQSALGAIGVISDPDDPQKRVSHEQPGAESTNSASVGKPVD